jgi:hypothetical protein
MAACTPERRTVQRWFAAAAASGGLENHPDPIFRRAFGIMALTRVRTGPHHPVVCITWQDARGYAEWLASRTGHPYRLLREAERAGNRRTARWLGLCRGSASESLADRIARTFLFHGSDALPRFALG